MSQGHRPPHGGQGSSPRRHDGAGAGMDRAASDAKIAALLTKIVFKKEALPRDIFSDIAQEAARLVKNNGGDGKNRPTQLRRFYDELVMWNDSVQQGSEDKEEKYKELEPFIKMLKAKVAYAKGRNHVDKSFERFFSHCIDRIDSHDSLKHCKFFMEAFMGYSKALEKGE